MLETSVTLDISKYILPYSVIQPLYFIDTPHISLYMNLYSDLFSRLMDLT